MTTNNDEKEDGVAPIAVPDPTPVALETPDVGGVVEGTHSDPDANKADKNVAQGEAKSTVLRVKADQRGISPVERRWAVKKLAAAITHEVAEHGEVEMRAFGAQAVYKAVKALAIARGYVATQGYDLYNVNAFADAEMGGIVKTGIKFICFVSKNKD